MVKRLFPLLGLLLACAPASAQFNSSGRTDLTAINSAISTLQSSMPTPCNTVPTADTLNGTAGSGNCFIPATATRPTVIQAATVTTAGDGTWTVTWAKNFSAATYAISTAPQGDTSIPLLCQATTKSVSAVSGKCWLLGTSVAVSVGALPLTVTISASASGITMNVIGRELTQ